VKTYNSGGTRNIKFPEQSGFERETDVLQATIAVLRRYLPPTWALETTVSGQDRLADAQLSLRAPDGRELMLLVEAKRLIGTRDVPAVLERLRRAIGGAERYQVPMIVARYLAPATRERIAEAGASYIDVTGNLYVAADNPSMLLRDRGADRDPWRGPGRPRGTLNGPPAARVARALIDFAPPFSVPELAARAGASTGATYRVVDFLDELQLVERAERGSITTIQWRAILDRWSRDYGFAQANTVVGFIEPRGLSVLSERLRAQRNLEYVITGSMAAEAVAPYAPARTAMLYVRDIEAAADTLELRPTTTGANVVLAAGDYDVPFARVREIDGLTYAALSQVAVDLLSGPGRNPNEAVALMDWMERNEPAWRS